MANQKSKTDRLHDQLSAFFKTRDNPNWKAIIEAIGEQDQFTADLIEEVRKQFFVKTASRPYLDRLGANSRVDRPRFIGMDDPTFRNYIPVLAYQPKQVKLIIDSLLDIFFFKESTTAYIETNEFSPYNLEDGWELEITVDSYKNERIQFNEDDFTDIHAITAEELVAAINRQAKHCFAVVFNNSVTKQKSIRLFTNTIGSKGSLEVIGGRANIGLRFDGFIEDAGDGNNTEWTVTKVGDLITFEHTAGNSPGIQFIKAGDIFISDIGDNIGSFVIESVVINENKFSFRNLFGTPGVYTQVSDRESKFIRPIKAVAYKNKRRALSWEVKPGEIIVEMPTSPPVVRRSLSGSMHINGLEGLMTGRVGDTQLILEDASSWPTAGSFVIEPKNEIQTKIVTISENTTTTKIVSGRLIGFEQKYTYSGKSGNTLLNVSPNLPAQAQLNEFNVVSVARDANNIITVNTATNHNFLVGESAIISGTTPTVDVNPALNLDISVNGTWVITEIVSGTSFKAKCFGDEGTATGGTVRVERIGMAASESKVILTDSIDAEITGIKGPYIWDLSAPFVLSSYTGPLAQEIKAGQILKTIDLGTNNLQPEGGNLIFDYGTEKQEGPVKYLFKPSDNTITIDPAYVFQYDHDLNSAVTAIRRKGPHQLRGDGSEYAPYITDPSVAREILQDLILQVKSVGIFVEFLVRYPEQLYATIDVYRSGQDPG
jgi:hypothetical protein